MATSVLDELLVAARRRSRADARISSLAELRREVGRMPAARRFESTLRAAQRVSVIAEAKRSSPSAGAFDLRAGPAAVAELSRDYTAAGVAALSILTEPTRFGGSDDDLVAAARIGLPVLRKDFVVDAYGVWQARALGADAVLLIVRALGDDLLRMLITTAGEAGLDALVEVHDGAELERALDADATLIGVNARDLATLEVDLDASLPLLRHASDAGATVVAESAIAGPEDVARASEAGAAAVLVGTSLLRTGDPGGAAARLVHAAPRRTPAPSLPLASRTAVKACGMRTEAGIRAAVAADADLVGFVLDQRSSRAVAEDRAAELIGILRGPRPVLVFRAPSRDEVVEALNRTGAAGIQLAGYDTPPSWLTDVAGPLEVVIGVVHAPRSVTDALRGAEAWTAAGATHVLLDGAPAAVGGGSGSGAPVEIARRLGRIVPV
ncbi:MAG: hypothetical protein H0W96_14535, partial [Solirubrobacterales bacterium]|nr:hypothetical protein [Solirubrobacterales bacterium]